MFVGLHLEYDATWYVLGERSMRLRRGLWTVRETTLTYANVQNVSVKQGPLQRLFGVSDLLVETAGGGTAKQPGEGADGHRGLSAGLGDAAAVRDRITARVSAARDAGLGDEAADRPAPRSAGGFTAAHVAVLREIRDLVADPRRRRGWHALPPERSGAERRRVSMSSDTRPFLVVGCRSHAHPAALHCVPLRGESMPPGAGSG